VALTYFEFTTLAILRLMSHSLLDVAILEVGLGGRLDATNVIDPTAPVITSIDIDHVEYLGPDREHRARRPASCAPAGRWWSATPCRPKA
jgi:dihydrofolate synthase/folylpolyglutamate synthase